ncbi:MAG: carboxypeptidase regulatory-like domain-containing protein [Verrucomicrobiota bacterium]
MKSWVTVRKRLGRWGSSVQGLWMWAVSTGFILLVTSAFGDDQSGIPIDLEIKVVNSEDSPVEGAQVFLSSVASTWMEERYPILLEGETDGEGIMEGTTKPFPEDHIFIQMAVIAIHETFGAAFSWIQVRQPIEELTQATVKLEKTSSVEVKILDPEGKPTSDLEIRVSGLSKMLPPYPGNDRGHPMWIYPPTLPGDIWKARTDAEGVAVIAGIPEGNGVQVAHDLSEWATLQGRHHVIITSLKSGGESESFRLQPAGSLQGRVTLPDGSPASDVEVRLRNFMPYTTAHGDTLLTDENGEYRFEMIPAGGYDVMVSVGGELRGKWTTEEEKGFQVAEGATVEGADFVLEKAYTVTGKMVDSETGEEVAEPQLWILPKGTHEIYFSAMQPKGYHVNRDRFEVVVGEEESLEIEIKCFPIQESDKISGVVVDEAGELVAGASVDFTLTESPYQKTVVTNDDGSFELSLIPGQEISELFASKGEMASAKKVKIRPGSGVRLVIGSTHFASVTGRVVDENGDPVAGARIRWNSEKIPGMPEEAISGEDGRFLIEQLVGGTHVGFFVNADGYGEGGAQEAIQPGEVFALSDIQLLLAQSKVSGRVVDSEGSPVSGAAVEVDGYLQPSRGVKGMSSGDGSFELSGLVDRWFWISGSMQTSDRARRYFRTRAKAGMTDVRLVLPDDGAEYSYPELIDHLDRPAPPLNADDWVQTRPLPKTSLGKVRVINFLAMDRSWIFFSNTLPVYQQFRNQNPRDDLEVILVQGPWPRQETEEILARDYPDISLPIAIESRENPMSEALGVSSWQTVVIDQNNVVRFQHQGRWNEAKRVALDLLAEPGVE